jgi:predicted Zn-ribbon and HTH transcriptional regulator
MIIAEMKCQMCGQRFEVELLDREDPKEQHLPGVPVRCPNCKRSTVEEVRMVRRVTRRAS